MISGRIEQVFTVVHSHPLCEFEHGDDMDTPEAKFVLAQSVGGEEPGEPGFAVQYRFACRGHMATWWEDATWMATAFELRAVRHADLTVNV